MNLDLDDVGRLVEAIRPILAGAPPPVVGAALADLLAIWLAGHFDRGGQTAALRAKLLVEHIEAVQKLIPINEAHLLSRQS